MAFAKGARPSPRHRLAAAKPHTIVAPTPPNWLWKPSQMSMWLNNQDGDCVTAEEAFAKACHTPEIFIPDQVVGGWAAAHGVLNGAELTQVLDFMQSDGFVLPNGARYNDGPYTSVDWTNAAVLQNAIAHGPVKIGIASSQLENVVGDPPVSGWFALGFHPDSNMDHCVSLCGYGTIEWLWLQFTPGVSLPSWVDVDAPAYAMFTWDSIGIIDVPSLIAITGEAWLRNPTTVIA